MRPLILTLLLLNTAHPCDLRKLDRQGVAYENTVYIARKEKDQVIYRGISTTKGEAVDQYFKSLKDRKCPEPLPKL